MSREVPRKIDIEVVYAKTPQGPIMATAPDLKKQFDGVLLCLQTYSVPNLQRIAPSIIFDLFIRAGYLVNSEFNMSYREVKYDDFSIV